MFVQCFCLYMGGVGRVKTQGFILGGGGGGGVYPPLDPKCPPLDFDFILPHSLVVDATPPYISNTLVCPPPP